MLLMGLSCRNATLQPLGTGAQPKRMVGFRVRTNMKLLLELMICSGLCPSVLQHGSGFVHLILIISTVVSGVGP